MIFSIIFPLSLKIHWYDDFSYYITIITLALLFRLVFLLSLIISGARVPIYRSWRRRPGKFSSRSKSYAIMINALSND